MSCKKSNSWLAHIAVFFVLLGIAQLCRQAAEKELRDGTPESIVKSRRGAILPGAAFSVILGLGAWDCTVLGSLGIGACVAVVFWIQYRWTLGAMLQGTHPYYDYHPEQRPTPHVG